MTEVIIFENLLFKYYKTFLVKIIALIMLKFCIDNVYIYYFSVRKQFNVMKRATKATMVNTYTYAVFHGLNHKACTNLLLWSYHLSLD